MIVAHEGAIRGLDMPQLHTVILTMLPASPDAYIHIAGRAGRAGRPGRAVSLFTPKEVDQAGVITLSLKQVRWKMRYDQEMP